MRYVVPTYTHHVVQQPIVYSHPYWTYPVAPSSGEIPFIHHPVNEIPTEIPATEVSNTESETPVNDDTSDDDSVSIESA